MKKIYESPEVLIVKLSTVNMMATSPMNFSGDGESGGGGLNDDDDASGDAMVKGGGVWDENW